MIKLKDLKELYQGFGSKGSKHIGWICNTAYKAYIAKVKNKKDALEIIRKRVEREAN